MLLLPLLGGYGYVFLHAEAQWQVAILALAGVAAILAAGSRRVGAALDRSWRAAPSLLGWLAFVVAAALIYVLREDHFALLMVATVLLYALVCLGLNVQFGYAGVLNFAGAAFFGIGGYTAAVLAAHTALPHLVILASAGLLSGVVGSLLVLPLLRTRGHYAALITIAFAILFRTFLEVNDLLGGPQGLKVPGLAILGWSFNDSIVVDADTEFSFYVAYAGFSLVLFTIGLILVWRLERSWLGLSLDAVRIDETAASVFGFQVARWKILAFSLGNVLAGVAGAVYGMMTGFVAPASFTLAESLIFVSIVILGGLGNPAAVLPATVLVVVLPEKLQFIQEYRYLLFSAIVILILLFKPAGLLPRSLRRYFPSWGKA
ncbi:MAG: branched-chain amino acid ABC transporter permease [Burkholderiales bacterium]|nr:branched-chain amino acid ABC transporter permease [Burkholderiales bacterium]